MGAILREKSHTYRHTRVLWHFYKIRLNFGAPTIDLDMDGTSARCFEKYQALLLVRLGKGADLGRFVQDLVWGLPLQFSTKNQKNEDVKEQE